MNKEAQRIAIAEACGWYQLDMPPGTPCGWAHPQYSSVINSYYLPDYLNDLNAMHEAEKWLGKPLCYHYVDHLPTHLEGRTNFALAHATAARRAEAFLKTLGLWEEEA